MLSISCTEYFPFAPSRLNGAASTLKLALDCVQEPQPVQTASTSSAALSFSARLAANASLLPVAADHEQLGANGVIGHETAVVKCIEERHARDPVLRSKFAEVARV